MVTVSGPGLDPSYIVIYVHIMCVLIHVHTVQLYIYIHTPMLTEWKSLVILKPYLSMKCNHFKPGNNNQKTIQIYED